MAGHGGNVQTPEQYAKARIGKVRSKLTVLRYNAGLSRKQLGELTGYTAGAINIMERKGSLNVVQAKRIAPALDVDWTELVE